MNRPARDWAALSALIFLLAAEARAATEEQVLLTELKEAQCEAARRSVPSPSGGGFSSSSISDDAPVLRPIQRTGPRQIGARATRTRLCAEAEELRRALEWEQRPASSIEAVWEAVFEPLEWTERTAGLSRAAIARTVQSPLTERYIDASDAVLRGHPPSEKRMLSNAASQAVAAYRLIRRELIVNRICRYRDLVVTSGELADALSEIDALAAPEKDRLVKEALEAVSPGMVAKLTDYAAATVPTVWHASPDFFSELAPDTLAPTVRDLCAASQYRR